MCLNGQMICHLRVASKAISMKDFEPPSKGRNVEQRVLGSAANDRRINKRIICLSEACQSGKCRNTKATFQAGSIGLAFIRHQRTMQQRGFTILAFTLGLSGLVSNGLSLYHIVKSFDIRDTYFDYEYFCEVFSSL